MTHMRPCGIGGAEGKGGEVDDIVREREREPEAEARAAISSLLVCPCDSGMKGEGRTA